MAQMNTPSCPSREDVKKGPWSWEEDQILINYIRINGTGKWATLPKKAGLNRIGKSCRLRWLNYLRPGIVRGNISKDEEDIIIKFQSFVGNRWSSIAKMLPGRTDNEIKNYWNTTLAKRLCYSKQPSTSTKKNRSKTPKKKLHDPKLMNNLHWTQTMTTTCDTLKYPMITQNEENYGHHQMVVNNAPPTWSKWIGGNDLNSTINIGDPKIAHEPVEYLMTHNQDRGQCSNYNTNTNSTIGSTLEREDEHDLFDLLRDLDVGNFDNVFDQDQVHVINPNLVDRFSRVVEEDQPFSMNVANHDPCKNAPPLPQLDPLLIEREGNDDNLFKFEAEQVDKDYEMKFEPNMENNLMAELEKLASFLGVDEWNM